MWKFKNYVRQFITDESGDQMIEYAIIIAIAATLIGVATGIASSARGKMDDAQEAIDGIEDI